MAYAPVTVELDRARTMRLTWRAIREIRETTGVDLLRGVSDDLDLDHIPAMLAAMLRHEDPQITTEQVETLIDVGNLEDVLEAFFCALGVDMPQSREESAEGNPPKGKRRSRKKRS